MKSYLLILSLIFHNHLFGQNPDNKLSINITATTPVSGEEYLINIFKSKNKIKIVYSIRDSVDNFSLQQNKNYKIYKDTLLKLFNNIKDNQKAFKFHADKLNSLIRQYSYYYKDSIILNAKKSIKYHNLLKDIFVTPTEELENKEGNKSRIILDGTSFEFHLLSSKQDRILYAHSPREISHPVLYKLILETFNVYRQNKGNLFLKNRRIGDAK